MIGFMDNNKVIAAMCFPNGQRVLVVRELQLPGAESALLPCSSIGINLLVIQDSLEGLKFS
jgi:hypothetical protein